MQILGSGLGPDVDFRWARTTHSLLNRLPTGDEDMLARASVVLAWIDGGYRSRGLWSSGMREVAASLDEAEAPSWLPYVAAVDGDHANEVRSLMRFAECRLPCGPTFDGSAFVDGADADLIVNRCLYDVKTTVNPHDRLPANIRQLIGYALLDWHDRYELERIGFYFARQGRWMDWPLERLVKETTGDRHATLSGLRDEFRLLAEENSPRRRLAA